VDEAECVRADGETCDQKADHRRDPEALCDGDDRDRDGDQDHQVPQEIEFVHPEV
jgi:hypothetical protein